MGSADNLTAGVRAGSWLPGCLTAIPSPSYKPAFDWEGKSEKNKRSEDLGLNESKMSAQERLEIRHGENVEN